MNIALIALLLLMSMRGSGKESPLKGLNLESLAPLVDLVSKSGEFLPPELAQKLNLDNFKIGGMNLKDLMGLYGKFRDLSSFMPSFTGGSGESSRASDSPKPDLSPIANIADKNVTYALNRYLSKK